MSMLHFSCHLKLIANYERVSTQRCDTRLPVRACIVVQATCYCYRTIVSVASNHLLTTVVVVIVVVVVLSCHCSGNFIQWPLSCRCNMGDFCDCARFSLLHFRLLKLLLLFLFSVNLFVQLNMLVEICTFRHGVKRSLGAHAAGYWVGLRRKLLA